MHPFKKLISYLSTLPKQPVQIELGVYTDVMSQGIDHLYPPEDVGPGFLQWWLPEDERIALNDAHRKELAAERKRMANARPTAIVGIPMIWGAKLTEHLARLVFEDQQKIYLSLDPEVLICQLCGYHLEPEDCRLKNGLPACVEECPLSSEEYKAQFGDWEVIS